MYIFNSIVNFDLIVYRLVYIIKKYIETANKIFFRIKSKSYNYPYLFVSLCVQCKHNRSVKETPPRNPGLSHT